MVNRPLTQSEYDGKPKYLRGKSLEYQSLYGRKWRKYRIKYLADHPLCVECERKRIVEPSKIVDHIIPHKGDIGLFWNKKNHQALCKTCHDKKTAKESAWK